MWPAHGSALLAVGDGAMGGALAEVFSATLGQRCWFHNIGNVLNAVPKSQQPRMKAAQQAIWKAATRERLTDNVPRLGIQVHRSGQEIMASHQGHRAY